MGSRAWASRLFTRESQNIGADDGVLAPEASIPLKAAFITVGLLRLTKRIG